ncbi:MAG: hypothetical protein R3250_11660 [Melioribacteraceae bacterium]|nr:hypothetical protein [Melioribacteraceae bacterium]
MDRLEHLVENKKVFFDFMNENYTIFKYSNLFFRDLQYALISYFEMKEHPVKYAEAEKLAQEFIDELVSSKDLDQIDYKSWRINFDFGIVKKEIEREGVEDE